MVNDVINNKIEGNKERPKTKVVKPIQVEEEADLSFLDELEDVFSDDFLEQINDTF
jgi:hypothetical protein